MAVTVRTEGRQMEIRELFLKGWHDIADVSEGKEETVPNEDEINRLVDVLENNAVDWDVQWETENTLANEIYETYGANLLGWRLGPTDCDVMSLAGEVASYTLDKYVGAL